MSEELLNKIKNLFSNIKLYHIIIFLVLFIGILLRTKHFLEFSWLWGDEIALFENINDINIFQIFMPLQSNQSAPSLFLFFSKINLEIFRLICKDYTIGIKIIPYLASVISVISFYYLSKKIFTNKINIILANLIFCFNMHLIFFAQDFKQYSSDVCTFILILLSYFYIDIEKLERKNIYLIGFLYMLSIWFSFTGIYAVAAVLIVIISQNLKRNNILKLFYLTYPFIIGLIGLYITQSYLSSNSFLHKFWGYGFISNSTQFLFFIKTIIYYLGLPISKISIAITILFELGIFKLILTVNKPKSQLLLIPVIFMVFASALYIYPFYERLSLYMFPLFILITLYLFELKQKYLNYLSLLLAIPALILVLKYQNPFTYTIYNPRNPIKYAQENCNSETLLINNYDVYTYNLYKDIYDLKDMRIVIFSLTFKGYASLENLPKGQYCLINSNTESHPDTSQLSSRKCYQSKILNAIKNSKISEIYNDGKDNILIKFKK